MRSTTLLLAVALAGVVAGSPVREPVPDPQLVVADDGDRLAADVVVVGSSSGGVAAAIGAARQGASVLLVSEVDRIGGMVTNGVTTDLLDDRLGSGLLDEWRREVSEVYRWSGVDPARYRGGLYAPPAVALEAMERLLYAEDVAVLSGWWVDHTDEHAALVVDGRVEEIAVTDGTSQVSVAGGVFIDATVEGDLLAVAGVEGVDWTWGREASETYDETLAPETADRLTQASTWRVTVQVGADPPDQPDRYDEWRPLYDQVPMGPTRWRCVVWDGWRRHVFTGGQLQRCLPDGMMDINIDLVGIDHGYLETDRAGRDEIADEHRDFVTGWVWHLAHVHGWPVGLASDQYADGWPEVLYLREGRRLLGRHVFTEHDAVGGLRSDRAVAVGDYGLDSHCVTGSVSGGPDCEGGWWVPVTPYQVPYDVLVPRRLVNVLAPVPVSASRVGYQTLRMEPVRMALGYAAGVAAALAPAGVVVGVEVADLQAALAAAGQLH